MEGYKISKFRLTNRLEPYCAEWARAAEQLHPEFDQ